MNVFFLSIYIYIEKKIELGNTLTIYIYPVLFGCFFEEKWSGLSSLSKRLMKTTIT